MFIWIEFWRPKNFFVVLSSDFKMKPVVALKGIHLSSLFLCDKHCSLAKVEVAIVYFTQSVSRPWNTFEWVEVEVEVEVESGLCQFSFAQLNSCSSGCFFMFFWLNCFTVRRFLTSWVKCDGLNWTFVLLHFQRRGDLWHVLLSSVFWECIFSKAGIELGASAFLGGSEFPNDFPLHLVPSWKRACSQTD